jgi:hypothetical protein
VACSSTWVIKGLTTWFCCGNAWGPCGTAGTGACGTCQSDQHMAAWPNLSGACLSITDPGACGESPPQRGCGYVMKVHCRCLSNNVCVTFADCGPDTQLFCGQQDCCPSGQGPDCETNRVIDLTPAAFSVIGDLSAGVLPVHIYE